MFNMGLFEIVILGVIALVVIGPKQLPEVARTLASLANELKRATSDLKDSMTKVRRDIDDQVNEVASSIGDPSTWVQDDTNPATKEDSTVTTETEQKEDDGRH